MRLPILPSILIVVVPMRRLLLIAIASIAATQIVYAQPGRFVGDSQKKLYWAFECAQAKLIPLSYTVPLATEEIAHDKGYKKADGCSEGMTTTATGIGKVKVLEFISNIPDYVDRTTTVRGVIEISTKYVGAYADAATSFYAFRVLDETGSMYVYMPKSEAALKLRRLVATAGTDNDFVGLLSLRPRFDRQIFIKEVERGVFVKTNMPTQYNPEAELIEYSDLKLVPKQKRTSVDQD